MEQTTPENLSARDILAFDLAYDHWIADGACAHPFMCVAREAVSSWSGLSAFQQALRGLGDESYATLSREIPMSNGGLTTPADARACLAELGRFSASGAFGRIVELVERGGGDVIHERVGQNHGWLGTNGAAGITLRLTEDGAFQIEQGAGGVMRHDADARVLFRSKAFSQEWTQTGDFRFTDLSSGERFLCADKLVGSSGRDPAIFEVTQRRDDPARYAYCVEPLRRVFQAAVDTGHPVLWS